MMTNPRNFLDSVKQQLVDYQQQEQQQDQEDEQ